VVRSLAPQVGDPWEAQDLETLVQRLLSADPALHTARLAELTAVAGAATIQHAPKVAAATLGRPGPALAVSAWAVAASHGRPDPAYPSVCDALGIAPV
jgi:hypothetical protein